MEHRVATDEICVKRGMGKPHQAVGGDSSESPPAVFWLQKTLLAKAGGLLLCQLCICDKSVNWTKIVGAFSNVKFNPVNV